MRRAECHRAVSLVAAGLAPVLLMVGLGTATASAQVMGDRAERCSQALPRAEGIQQVTQEFLSTWSHRDRRTTYQLLNAWLAPNSRSLLQIIRAPQNQESLREIARISQELGSNQNVTRANVERIAKLGSTLKQSIRERREFTVTFTDDQGQQQTKTTAC